MEREGEIKIETERPTKIVRKNLFGAIMLRLSNIDIKLKMVTVSLWIFYIDVMKVLVHRNNSNNNNNNNIHSIIKMENRK